MIGCWVRVEMKPPKIYATGFSQWLILSAEFILRWGGQTFW